MLRVGLSPDGDITFWLNYVFAGEAQIWDLGFVTQRFLFLTGLFFNTNLAIPPLK